MRDLFRARRSVPGPFLCAALALALGACGPEEDSGYDKVADREKVDIAAPAAPAPPRVIAGIGETDAGGQVIAASLPEGVTQEMVDEGQRLYGTVCVACHGPAGGGSPAGPALADDEWINVTGNFDEIVNIIHTGVPSPRQFPGPMPALGGGSFTDEQVRALAAYVYALSHQADA